MITQFEDITNQIAQLIKNDIAIQTFSSTNLGGNLTVIDNLIIKKEYIPDYPFCAINKNPETAFKNDESRARGKSNIWQGTIMFFGKFEESQANDNTFKIPQNAQEVINGITTYKPSDYMRIIARMVGEIITNQVACTNETQGVILSNYSIIAEDYYANEDGTVASELNFEVYKRNNFAD